MVFAWRTVLTADVLFTITGCCAAVIAALDNAMSVGTKSDCSISRVLWSEPLCKADGLEQPKEDLYCYRTLGNVSCYRNEDPYATEGTDTQSKRAAPGG